MHANDDTEHEPGERDRESLWLATTPRTDYPPLDGDGEADVAVVGGGIVGLTAAYELADAGRDVLLLERDRIVEGVTGRTTAKVTAKHGVVYVDLAEKRGLDAARQYAEANQGAVEYVADRVDDLGLDCGFERVSAYSYAESNGDRETYREEAETAAHLGLPASYTEDVPVLEEAVAGVRFDGQAIFHPREYLLGLAEAAADRGCRIREGTRVREIDDGAPCRVATDRGSVTAADVVVATHFPFPDRAGYFARQHPKRSYLLALRVADPPTGVSLYRPGTPYFSVRPHETADGEVLTLVGGQDHKTGHGGSTAERYHRLEAAARERFDVESVEHRWSTQDYSSVDGVPFVGRLGPNTDHVYTGTGFGGWGMTGGTAAGRILAALIRRGDHPHAEVFDPARLSVRASAASFASENAAVAATFADDWLTKPRDRELRTLGRGEGTIVRRGSDVLAVSRDESGDLTAVSAICPHMGCLLEWNDGEASWDCPCHGSRFDADGHLLDGPAVEDLPRRDADE